VTSEPGEVILVATWQRCPVRRSWHRRCTEDGTTHYHLRGTLARTRPGRAYLVEHDRSGSTARLR